MLLYRKRRDWSSKIFEREGNGQINARFRCGKLTSRAGFLVFHLKRVDNLLDVRDGGGHTLDISAELLGIHTTA
jgi:hypothetical protein